MRKRFEIQLELGATPIEEIKIPTKSRDELPPVLRALQYIYITPRINERVFDLLEKRIKLYKKGKPGLSLWEILVLGIVRLTLDINYDRLEHVANYDSLVRGMLGVKSYGLEELKRYSLTSLKENISKLDEDMLEEINEIVVKEGHRIKKKEGESISVKIDSYVLESTVHFPTDINLLYDSGRKIINVIEKLIEEIPLSGWRKKQAWRGKLKNGSRRVSQKSRNGGKRKEELLKKETKEYLKTARQIKEKLGRSRNEIRESQITPRIIGLFEELKYYERMLDKHIDLIDRRIIKGEKIPHSQKIFSIFEPYTEWVQKGKKNNQVELGLRIGICSDQFGFIIDHRVMVKEQDVDTAVPMVERLIRQYKIESVSFDKGYWSPDNKEKIKKLVSMVVMPKKGRKRIEEKVEESSKKYKQLKRSHCGIESNINSLEHHGLNRCPDKGLKNFKKYTSLGILSYNLDQLGKLLQEEEIKKQRRKAA